MDKEASQELISTEAVLDVMQYPEKVYASRIVCEDGSDTDMAVCGRKDQTGINCINVKGRVPLS